MNSNRVAAYLGCLVATVVGIVPANANPVSLPFSENFQSVAPSANADVDYPAFTAIGVLTKTVDATGVLRLGTASNPPASQFFTVTPTGYAGSELVIKIDMGFDGQAGFGATALRLGANTMVFHPGYNAPNGAFRVEGTGGIATNSDMGWLPQLGVLNHVEIHSFPSGLFNIKVTDGSNPANVYTNSFTNLASYGGDIGPSAIGAPAAIFDNLSIQAVPEPSSIVLSVGIVGLCFARCRQGRHRDGI